MKGWYSDLLLDQHIADEDGDNPPPQPQSVPPHHPAAPAQTGLELGVGDVELLGDLQSFGLDGGSGHGAALLPPLRHILPDPGVDLLEAAAPRASVGFPVAVGPLQQLLLAPPPPHVALRHPEPLRRLAVVAGLGGFYHRHLEAGVVTSPGFLPL